MYRVTAYFKNHKVTQKFYDLYDAIDWRDVADAHYPSKVTFEKESSVREWIYNCWNGVMNADVSPLKNINDLQVRHMVLQLLAWMWCITFAMIVGSWTVFGISAVSHLLLLAAIAITVGTFETAKRKPDTFSFVKGYHSGGRSRGAIWIDGKKINLPKGDPGGEHE
ncbi:hypothetical protein N9V27_01365 [bacterium]|nr:hypothetical protein [bacterium]